MRRKGWRRMIMLNIHNVLSLLFIHLLIDFSSTGARWASFFCFFVFVIEKTKKGRKKH
ncbi:hypothetical protein F4810DRAFT_683580 [Camillea tinctor]|nr:hypothetical protein F4810DRAFT_683580 [Camillea tinctor]